MYDRYVETSESVHSGEALIRRASAQQIRNLLSSLVDLDSLDGVLEEQVAVVSEDGAIFVVEFIGLSSLLENLDGPLGFGNAGLMQSLRQPTATSKHVEAAELLCDWGEAGYIHVGLLVVGTGLFPGRFKY